MNCWQLAREGVGNEYYAAAVRSMLQSWHNFFFVSFDPGGFVTVDKPPLGFWIQTASAKLFGFHGWTILLPQALAGVPSVALLYHLVRRVSGPAAGLVAALALAVTPISVVTNRNNTIDSLLVLTAARRGLGGDQGNGDAGGIPCAGCCRRCWSASASTSRCWKPTWRSPRSGWSTSSGRGPRWRKRIGHLALATLVLLAVSLSWATAVDLTPASQRP